MPSLVLDIIIEQSEKEMEMANSLDVRSGILLGLVAVLVASNAALLSDPHLLKWVGIAQLLSLLIAAVAALLAFIALFPPQYKRPFGVAAKREWIAKMEKILSSPNESVERVAIKELMPQLETNQRINHRRNIWLFFAFATTATALMIDIITLAISTLGRLSS